MNKNSRRNKKANPTTHQPRKSPEGQGKVCRKEPSDKDAGMSLLDQGKWYRREV